VSPPPRLRLLVLTDRLATRGGADQHLAAVIAAAVEGGLRVTVAYGRAETGCPPPPGARVVRVRGLAGVTASSGLAALPALLADCDAVHVQNVMNPAALTAAIATGRALVTVQDHRVFCPGPGRTLPDGNACQRTMGDAACRACLPDDGYRARILARTLSRCDALAGARFVVLSRYMASELAAAGLPGAIVLPPWIEPGPPRREAGDAFLLGGRLVAHKGVLEGWEAWRAAGAPLPLRVAGSGPLAAALEGCERLGWLDTARLAAELRRARALLFPARWQEPFGILGVEALAAGTPVVVTARGGTGEWSDAGCLVVPPGDIAAMTAALWRLAADPELALALGRAGQAMVRERFARAVLWPRLLALYGEVAGGAAAF
jgi:hypothetical protein